MAADTRDHRTDALGAADAWRLLGPFRGRALRVLALMLLDTGMASLGIGMVLPVFQALVDPQRSNAVLEAVLPFVADLQPVARLQVLAALTIAVFVAKAAVALWSTVSSNAFLLDLRVHWIARIGEQYLQGPLRRVTGRKQGELLNDWFNETLAAMRFYQSTLTYLSSAALVVALVVVGALVDWRAMLAMLVFGALIVVAMRRYLFGSATRLSKVKMLLGQQITASMLESLSHARDIKLMGAEQLRLGGLAGTCWQLKSAVLRATVFADVPRVAGELIAVVALMAFVVAGSRLGTASPAQMLPTLVFFFIAFYRIVGAGSAAMTARVKALNELHSVKQVYQLLDHAGMKEDLTSGLPLVAVETDIRLSGIRFAYDAAAPILAGIDAVIPKGRTTYLVGRSGAGKSTLLDILMRLEVASAGRIEVNGRDAGEFRLGDWRRVFGYVSQEATLFNGDIAMNLRLARPQASDEEIREACRLAGAQEFIEALPHGYATLVGDRGHSLSGGQRKRIAIARALIGRPSVLILDEATTSFEQSLEREMREGLLRALPGLTIIAVTHRLQSVAEGDWVISLERGHAAGCGPWNASRAAQHESIEA